MEQHGNQNNKNKKMRKIVKHAFFIFPFQLDY